jgi:hypothetical protein
MQVLRSNSALNPDAGVRVFSLASVGGPAPVNLAR